MIRRPPRPTRTNTLVPDTRVCRSVIHPDGRAETLLEVGGTYPNGIAVDGEGNVLWVESFTGRLRRLRPSGGLDELHTFAPGRSEEHTSELQSLMRSSYAVFCLKKKTQIHTH